MPIVAAWDGVSRRVILDPSVAGGSWAPVDLFREYLAYRRDNEAFRGFAPLMRMKGGEPKGGGKFAPRFLQLLTDNRGITTKLVLPDLGPYRTFVDGELATDVPDTDPEAFDVSGLTTTGIIIDYKPAEAEVIQVSTGSSLSASQATMLDEIWKRLGLDPANALTTTPASITVGGVTIALTGDGTSSSTATRQ